MKRNGSEIGVRILWVWIGLAAVCGGLGAAEKPRVVVADFKVVGDVGIPQAGRVVAVLLIELGPDRFEFMHAAEPHMQRERATAEYRLTGAVAKRDGLVVSARLVDAKTGKGVQTVEIRARDVRDLEAAVGDLAKLLVMTDDEKKAYLARGAGKPGPAVLAELKAACTRAAAQVERSEKEYNRLSKARERGEASESTVAEGKAYLAVSRAKLVVAQARVDQHARPPDRETSVRLAKAELALVVAQSELSEVFFGKFREGYKHGAVRKSELAMARAGLSASRAKVEAAKARLDGLLGRAPGAVRIRLAKASLNLAMAELQGAVAGHEHVREGEWRMLDRARARLELAKAKVAAAKAELAGLGGAVPKPATRPGRLDFSSLPKPGQRQFILDLAGLIEPADEKTIRQICDQLLTEKGEPIIVVTVRSMARHGGTGMEIETFARLLFDRWGIGSAKTNRGILFLVAQGDRKARIELGAGWKRDKDAAAQKIMDEEIIRRFKKGEFSGGIVAGVKALGRMARGSP